MPRALIDASGILFLCSGNMVRSAFAELYAQKAGLDLPVCSRATVYRNTKMFPVAARALRERGVPPEPIRAFRPTHLDDGGRIDPSDVAFGMTRAHLAALGDRLPCDRTFLLMEVVGSEDEIADPVEEGADFERTFELVARCVDRLVDLVRRIREKKELEL